MAAKALTAIASRMNLVDLRLMRKHSELLRAVPRLPLRLHTEYVKTTYIPLPGGAGYQLEYYFKAFDGRGAVVWTSLVTYFALYALEGDATDDELVAYVPLVHRLVHDHLRELLHSFTLRMGLPPLVLEPYRSGQIERGSPEAVPGREPTEQIAQKKTPARKKGSKPKR